MTLWEYLSSYQRCLHTGDGHRIEDYILEVSRFGEIRARETYSEESKVHDARQVHVKVPLRVYQAICWHMKHEP